MSTDVVEKDDYGRQYAEELFPATYQLTGHDGSIGASPAYAEVESTVYAQYAVRGGGIGSSFAPCCAPLGVDKFAEEEYGLHVEPRPQLNAASVQKLQQRLAMSRQLDVGRLLAAAGGAISGKAVAAKDAKAPSDGAEGTGPLPVVPEQAGPTGRDSKADATPGAIWFDQHGRLDVLPDPSKAGTERPTRQFDQDLPRCATWYVPPSIHSTALEQSAATGRGYQLDVELSRLEFGCHPLMAREDQLAAQLKTAFREYKRREATGLTRFYANRLMVLEEALLAARDDMFALQDDPSSSGGGYMEGPPTSDPPMTAAVAARLQQAYQRTAALEREVAEMRQLSEEQDQHMLATLQQLDTIWQGIRSCREQQGVALTNVQLTIVQLRPEVEELQPGALSRFEVDVGLLQAEEDHISGLPPPPEPLPLSRADAELSHVFPLRRLETTCSAHALALDEVTSRLQLLQERISADDEDPEVLELQQQLKLLGPAPRRLPLSPADAAESRARAEATAAAAGAAASPLRGPQWDAILSLGGELAGVGQHGISAHLAAPPCYVRLLVNGNVVGTSEAVTLGDDFSASLHDVFSLQLVKWPESMSLQLYERGKLHDTMLAEVYLAVPGASGTPHCDPQPRGYSWSSTTPVLPRGPPQQRGRVGSAGTGRVPMDTAAVYPSGSVFVRCAWVGSSTQASTGGAAAAIDTTLNATGISLAVAGRARSTVGGAGGQYRGSAAGASSAGTSSGGSADVSATIMFTNPLATPRKGDVEANHRHIMPPQPHVTIDRALRRTAAKPNKQHVSKWLGQQLLDPNDPRNAPLLELMRTREAAATGGGGGGSSGDGLLQLFRLDIVRDIQLQLDRVNDKRMNFIKRRWGAGAYRDPKVDGLRGARQVRIPAVLSAKETTELELTYARALALLEGGILGRAAGKAGDGEDGDEAGGRGLVERNLLWAQGALGAALELRQSRIRDFAVRLRAAAAAAAEGHVSTRRYKTEDVVKDTPLPEFKLDLSALARMLQPRRPLRPQRRAVTSIQHAVPRESQLVVTIQRASNLPTRVPPKSAVQNTTLRSSANRNSINNSLRYSRDSRMRSSAQLDQQTQEEEEEAAATAAQGAESSAASSLCCFAEVRFRGQTHRTAAVDSNMPQWNEQISLQVFDKGQEASPSALIESTDLLTINLFDEVASSSTSAADRLAAARLRPAAPDLGESLIMPERERRFLGCVQVPLSTIYRVELLEGVFQVDIPAVVLGYVQGGNQPPVVSLFITLKPRLAMPAALNEERRSGEQEDLARHAARWCESVSQLSHCRRRVVKAMAVDADGVGTLLTRYVAPTKLPPPLEDLATAAAVADPHAVAPDGCYSVGELMLMAARFVACVPWVADGTLVKQRTDIWCTSAEFLRLAGGDHEEHANLLAGYFQELGQEAYVVLGCGLTGGSTAFVLTTGRPLRDGSATASSSEGGATVTDIGGDATLWNPMTGHPTAVSDPSCELREVGTVYNQWNIWANVQAASHPCDMEWRLDTGGWLPLFGPTLQPRRLATLQSALLQYEDLEPRFYEELEARAEEAIRDALYAARSTVITQPHNKLSRVLKQLLRGMPAEMHAIQSTSWQAAASQFGPGQHGQEQGGAPTRAQLLKAMQESHNERVQRETRNTVVNGHVLCVPFTDNLVESISDVVLNTSIHKTKNGRVKFAMASYVEPLGSAFVCRIWLYVATVVET